MDIAGNIKNATVDYEILNSLKEKYNVANIVPVNLFNAADFPHFYVIDEQVVYQIEAYIKRGQIKIVNELPIAMSGHRLLECSFQTALANERLKIPLRDVSLNKVSLHYLSVAGN